MNPHIPTIRIRTPEPDEHGVTPGILHRIWVDGHEWAVTADSVGAEASDIQKITLT